MNEHTTSEHVILTGIVVLGATREEAEYRLHERLVPLLRNPESPIDSWWIAEDDRRDGSDLDSAVFVKQDAQIDAVALLKAFGLAHSHGDPLGTIKVIRERYRIDSLDGDLLDEHTKTEEVGVHDLREAIDVFKREGATFKATGAGWAANPDSQTLDYETGLEERVTVHFGEGFPEIVADLVRELVG